MIRALGAVIVIHAGALLADPGTKPLHEQTVVISDGKVSAVEVGAVLDRARTAPGYEADLIAVAGDLLVDVAKVHSVSFVMKGGAVVHASSAP